MRDNFIAISGDDWDRIFKRTVVQEDCLKNSEESNVDEVSDIDTNGDKSE